MAETVKIPLTEEEMASRGKAMAKLVREVELKEEKKKQMSKELGDEITGLNAEVTRLAKEINEKVKYEPAQASLPIGGKKKQ